MIEGEVAYQYVYDLGGEVVLDRVGEILSEHPSFEPLDITKTSPRWIELPKPLTVRFPAFERPTNVGPLRFSLAARIYSVGAVAFLLRVDVHSEKIDGLLPYGTLKHRTPTGDLPLETLVQPFFEEIRKSVRQAMVEAYDVHVEPEVYVVYALRSLPGGVENALLKERRQLAGLLNGETNPQRLAPEEVEDNLRYWYRYYDDDLAIVDWDYAVLVDPTGRHEDMLYLFEVANLQLLELRVYDRVLDHRLDQAYEDLQRFFSGRSLFQSARDLQQTLSDIHLDLQRVTDEVDNMAKIFGDWYYAKVYKGLAERFHLADWETSLRDKLRTLGELYDHATHEVEHRQGLLLEGLVILLFVADLILLFYVSKPF
ncbi:MAG: hypothetical protein ACYDDF_05860 [Thermoplasmatota archaeon]